MKVIYTGMDTVISDPPLTPPPPPPPRDTPFNFFICRDRDSGFRPLNGNYLQSTTLRDVFLGGTPFSPRKMGLNQGKFFHCYEKTETENVLIHGE